MRKFPLVIFNHGYNSYREGNSFLWSKCHLEFFDAYLKGLKQEPDLENNDAVTVTTFPPDIDSSGKAV